MRYNFKSVARDGAGNIVPSATVSVYLAGTTTAASVYATYTGGTAVNSVTTGTDGSFEFYVDDTDYAGTQRFKIVISKTGYSSITRDYISIFDLNAIRTILIQSTTVNTGGGFNGTYVEAASSALSGASGSIAVNVPSGARILGVQLRVDTAVTSGDGGTSWSADYVNTPTTAICSSQAFTKNTKYNALHAAYEITTDVVTITITPNSGTFSGGVIRAVVYYESLTALSDNP